MAHGRPEALQWDAELSHSSVFLAAAMCWEGTQVLKALLTFTLVVCSLLLIPGML